ncbi:MAG: glycosidase [Spirochaetes bacterium]|nr:glycosidase [Spirochaetota bacterium]
MIKLIRLSSEPVLMPKKEKSWEASAVFNCAAVYERGLVHLVYRATDTPSNSKDYISRLGYAVSADGVHFNRLEEPILTNDAGQEARGAEDPRIVKIEDVFHMLYTGYSGGDYRICRAESQNLIHWERKGIVLHEQNKDASLFPEKINGKYVLVHRRAPDIWIAWSDDLVSWTNHTVLLNMLTGSAWENKKIGLAGPPVKTDIGWLLIYHGVSQQGVYSLGAALLGLSDPSMVIARQREPILAPELPWEVHGHVPNVVFSCGQAVIGDRILIYYGGADTVIGAAELNFNGIRFD